MKIVRYSLYFLIPFLIDRITKGMALSFLAQGPITINRYLEFDLMFNRGISWGLLSSENSTIFVLVSLFIAIAMGLLLWFTVRMDRAGLSIFGLVLILSGGLSNLLDRVLYSGVIDFIVVHYNDWYFPTFNFADIFIEVGAAILIFQGLFGSWDS